MNGRKVSEEQHELPQHDESTDSQREDISPEDATASAREDAPSRSRIEPADDVATLKRERDEHLDRLLRQAAEFDNYRKRVERERRELAEFAAAELIKDLLPLVDDLERALAAAPPSSPAVERYRAGVELIHRQLLELLRKRGVTPIEALGADFDPHLHQAISQDVSPGHREGEVIEELRRGYKLGDRLLRPSMVKVASGE
jgi:molecular chaperone GrpE